MIPGIGIDYSQQPLGSLPGEQGLQSPYNLKPQTALVRVRNMSAVLERRVVKEYVSIRRGGEKQITEGPRRNEKNVSADALRYKVMQGENANWEVMAVAPQDAVLRHDGRRYLVPFPRDTSKDKIQYALAGQAPFWDFPALREPGDWVNVDPGLWDLYMGNWERMHGMHGRKDQSAELQQLVGRGLHKWVVGDDNPYGYLEFEREEIVVQEAVVDLDRVRTGQLVEI